MADGLDLYLGCYTTKLSEELDGKGQGIVHARFDPDALSLSLRLVAAQRNPTYLAKHPTLPVLYAAEELEMDDGPRVYAYFIEADKSLSLLNSQPVSGAFACHLAVVGDLLVVANYGSGNIDSYPLDGAGQILAPKPPIQHLGSGPNESRQEGPHAHMIYRFDQNWSYVADLGIDRCAAYHVASVGLTADPSLDLILPSGSGPRHLIRHATSPIAYVLTELTGEICSYQLTGTPEQVQRISFFPKSAHGIPSGAALKMDPAGQFLFASERTSSTLTQFHIREDGRLAFHRRYVLEDQTPRDFALIGEWLIVAGQDSHTLSFWKRQNDGGYHLRKGFQQVMTPSCVMG